MRKKTTLYLSNEELAEALQDSQSRGYPTEHVCKCFKKIAEHMLGLTKYRNYSVEMKEDMCSAALLKCIKNIKNFRSDKSSTCFNYYTRTTECAFFEVLGRHYKQQNIKRELTRRYADKLEALNTTEANKIRDSLLNENTTNTIHEGK